MRILSIFAANPKPWKNQLKINTFTCFACTVGGGVANNLNDASHLPHLTESFVLLCCTSCELTNWFYKLKLYFYIVDPTGTVTTRDSAISQTCRKWGNV